MYPCPYIIDKYDFDKCICIHVCIGRTCTLHVQTLYYFTYVIGCNSIYSILNNWEKLKNEKYNAINIYPVP